MVHKYFHERDGVGTYMSRLTRMLEARGHVVAPFAMHHPQNARSPWEPWFVSGEDTTGIGGPLASWRQLRRSWWHKETEERMAEVIERFQPDVVHVHNLYTHLSPSLLRACERAGVPVVMTVHDFGNFTANYGLWDGERVTSPKDSWFKVARTRVIKDSFLATFVVEGVARAHRLFGLQKRGIAAYITLSHAVAEKLRGFGVPREHICVIPPGIPTALTDALPSRARRDGVLFVGRYEEYKGVEDVIEMARQLPDVSFTTIGHGTLESALEVASHDLKNLHVLSARTQEQTLMAMASAELVLVPSRWFEPFGLVALEAQLVGTPTLVSGQGGLPEIVEDGVTGLVLPPRSPAVWAKAIKDLLKNTKKRQQMGAAAAERAKALAHEEAFVRAILDVYGEAVYGDDR